MLAKHGITTDTPKTLLFDAAAIYKNLKFDTDANDWVGEVLGATSGGSKFAYVSEFMDAEVDGAKVKVKGLKVKVGETGSLEVNATEFKEGVFKVALHLVEDATKTNDKHKCFVTKSLIDEDDYIENIALVGHLTSGEAIIFIMHNAFCVSGLEFEPKDKTQTTYTLTFEPHADIDSDLDRLPIEIYLPIEKA